MSDDRLVTRPRVLALLLATSLLAAACDSGGPEASPSPETKYFASVASYDLAADRPNRVTVGLSASDGRLISFGTVRFEFSFLGATEAAGPAEPGPSADAEFLPVPGDVTSGEGGTEPVLTTASEARGVYVAQDVDFGKAGIWHVDVRLDLAGEALSVGTDFGVVPRPEIPAVGEPALKTKNHLPGERGIPLTAIDSGAQGGTLSDPQLHRETIAAAIAARRPALVIFSTPVWCVSKFCGPVTEVVAQMATEHQGDAAFIHVEVWKDFQNTVVNKAAADWLLIEKPGQPPQLQEPWLFLIGRNGRILARWDNVFDPAEVVEALGDATNEPG
jgi:hypothetical protein